MALFRGGPVALAATVAGSRFGLLNRSWLPFPISCVLAILAIDLVKYAVHRGYHAVPFLWRWHQVHHSDPDFDLSTGTRAHPMEIVLSQAANLAAIAVLAPPVVAVLIAELTSLVCSFFGHANASLPARIEKPVRRILVTPDMHRIHHSEEMTEQFKNLGDIFPWWDHLFGTYLADPAAGQPGIRVGLKGCQTARSLGVTFMLLQPFRNPAAELPDAPLPQVPNVP